MLCEHPLNNLIPPYWRFTPAGWRYFPGMLALKSRARGALGTVFTLMGRGFQSGRVFWPTEMMVPTNMIPLLQLGKLGALPTYSKLVTTSKSGYLVDIDLIGESQREGLKDTQANITYAYLTSNSDRAMDSMFMELVERFDQGEDLTDEDIRKATDKCYTTMKMMLAES